MFSASWFLVAGLATGQNLVPNPSFEANSACPGGYSEMFRVDFWFQPTDATSDYLNACGGFPVGVPLNFAGTQNAADGDAYAGVIAYETIHPGGWWEYVAVPLKQALVGGEEYFVSFSYALASDSGWSTDGLGVRVYRPPLPQGVESTHFPINGSSLRGFDYAGPPLTNLGVWETLSGSFVAAGGEDHLVIGSFKDKTASNVVQINSSTTEAGYLAYIYIDNVYLEPTDPCPNGGTTIDFESLEMIDANVHAHGSLLTTQGFEFDSANVGFPIETFGTLRSDYSGSTAISTFPNDGILSMTKQGGGSFDVCSMRVSETSSQTSGDEATFGTQGFGVGASLVMDGVHPNAQRIYFDDFTNTNALVGTVAAFPAAYRIQWDDICVCLPGDCQCPPDIVPSESRYCISGVGTGVDWSWQLDGQPSVPVVVPAPPPGAPPDLLAAAFVSSINASGLTGPPPVSAVQNPLAPHCFEVIYTSGAVLAVGPSGSTTCNVTGNPSGCSFNPTITDASFLPPLSGDGTPIPFVTVPGLARHGWLVVLLVGLTTVSLVAIRIGRRRAR